MLARPASSECQNSSRNSTTGNMFCFILLSEKAPSSLRVITLWGNAPIPILIPFYGFCRRPTDGRRPGATATATATAMRVPGTKSRRAPKQLKCGLRSLGWSDGDFFPFRQIFFVSVRKIGRRMMDDVASRWMIMLPRYPRL